MKILVKKKNKNVSLPQVSLNGDWIDLYLSETITMEPGVNTLLPLGLAMKVPEGYEIILTPRSSTFINHGVFQSNSIGIIDNTYCGDEDLLYFPAYATRKVTIHAGTRICQFRVQLSQKATIWQKLKWLFDETITIEEVSSLGNTNRGGFGSTGK
jgi:dUTP pyrophosphatase